MEASVKDLCDSISYRPPAKCDVKLDKMAFNAFEIYLWKDSGYCEGMVMMEEHEGMELVDPYKQATKVHMPGDEELKELAANQDCDPGNDNENIKRAVLMGCNMKSAWTEFFKLNPKIDDHMDRLRCIEC